MTTRLQWLQCNSTKHGQIICSICRITVNTGMNRKSKHALFFSNQDLWVWWSSTPKLMCWVPGIVSAVSEGTEHRAASSLVHITWTPNELEFWHVLYNGSVHNRPNSSLQTGGHKMWTRLYAHHALHRGEQLMWQTGRSHRSNQWRPSHDHRWSLVYHS